MYAVDADETIHIYYEQKKAPQPFVVLPLVCALLCLLGIAAVTLYSAQHPLYAHARLVVAAHALPPQTFTAQVKVIPTGVKSYPATYAHGWLTFSNGSVIGLSIPKGFTIGEAVVERNIYVPQGSATGYGYAIVPAHALADGKGGDFGYLKINTVIGDALYVRNLSPFTGGHDAYSTRFATPQDKYTALLHAQGILLSKSSGLHYPCIELIPSNSTELEVVAWRCQFVSYHIPALYHVTAVRLSGKSLVIDVWFIPPVQTSRIRGV